MRGAVLAAAGFVVTTRRMSEHLFPRKHTATGRSTDHPAFQAERSAKWITCFWKSQPSPQQTRKVRINSSRTIVQSEHPNQTGQDVNTDHSQTLLQCHWCWTPREALSSLDCPKTKLLHDSFSRRYCSPEQKVEAGTEPVSLQEAWSHPYCKASPFQTL